MHVHFIKYQDCPGWLLLDLDQAANQAFPLPHKPLPPRHIDRGLLPGFALELLVPGRRLWQVPHAAHGPVVLGMCRHRGRSRRDGRHPPPEGCGCVGAARARRGGGDVVWRRRLAPGVAEPQPVVELGRVQFVVGRFGPFIEDALWDAFFEEQLARTAQEFL